jgi:hypothetical protein
MFTFCVTQGTYSPHSLYAAIFYRDAALKLKVGSFTVTELSNFNFTDLTHHLMY